MIVRLGNGRLQLRLAPPGRMTAAAERHFLGALAASANIRLSAAAAGFAHSSFYARRKTWVGFNARMGQALRVGYDRLEYVVMERTLEAIHGAQPEQSWLGPMIRDNPLPPLSFDQAFQTLCLHRNTVRLDGLRPPGRPSKVAPTPGQAMSAIGRNIDAMQRAEHYEVTGSWTLPREPAPPPALPPLEHVSGWSKAKPQVISNVDTQSPRAGHTDDACRPTGPRSGARSTSRDNGPVANVKVIHHPGRALFGGWRLDDWAKRKKAGDR